MAKCEACQVLLDDETADMMSQQFIAFDAEMTGLDPRTDRIVELGAVLFENGVPTKTFSSLVNCGLYIRPSSQNVNHITNESLKTAPREGEAYRSFLEFLGPSAQGKRDMPADRRRMHEFADCLDSLYQRRNCKKLCLHDLRQARRA